MRITNSSKLNDFCKKYTVATSAVERWVAIVSKANWKNHFDLKQKFPSADYVGNKRYVFNIKGNHFRLIVVVIFVAENVDVRFIGTHNEYDKITDIKNI